MIKQTFLRRVEKEPWGCWLWSGGVNADGYGTLRLRGEYRLAHRLSYELHVGDIPEGLTIDHLCRIRRCVNPYHLQAVTRIENVRRSNAVGSVNTRKTHCHRGHLFDEQNTQFRTMRNGNQARVCRECRRLKWRREHPRQEPKTHCPQGHEFTEENTRINANGHRVCRTCSRDRAREAKRAKGAQPRAAAGVKTHCVNGHAYTPENTYEYLRGGRTYRHCRECNRAARRKTVAR